MILRLEQKTRLPQRTHEVYDLSFNKICNAGVSKVFDAYIALNGELIKIVTDEICKSAIKKGENICGYINHKLEVTKKILFLPIGYEYDEIEYNGRIFTIYESGLGANQHFFSLYENNCVVAVIHKDDRVINYLNTYTLYAENSVNMDMALIYAMFLESTAFCDRTAGLGYSDVNIPHYSAQKELRDKYDPSFIQRVKMNDGVMDNK